MSSRVRERRVSTVMKPLFLLSFLLVSTLHAELLPARKPSIETKPRFAGTKNYTDYKPQPLKRVAADVMAVSNSGSFVSRCLRMLSRDGQSKNFETITGQDGITFGVKDFATDGGVLSFMQGLKRTHSTEMIVAFGEENTKHLIDSKWIKENNAGGHGKAANDAGLVRLDWFRKGLDQILTNPAIREYQLSEFVRETVQPSIDTFKAEGFKKEFTAGTMVGIANSAGGGGLARYLKAAKQAVGGSGVKNEAAIAKHILTAYVKEDPNPGSKDGDLLKIGFGEKPGTLSESGLGHRGRRAYQLFKLFPLKDNVDFSALGKFSL